jgi:hypothetical protein
MGRKNEEWERQARIVRYWRAVEYFSPPTVDRVDPRKGIYAVSRGRPLPWEREDLPATRPNCVWRHTVYAGIYDVAMVREVLQKVLHVPDAELDVDGRIRGTSALLSFAVDGTGHLLKDSVTLSSCAWAVGRTLTPGPGSDAWLSGFAVDQERLLDYLFEIGDGKIPIDHAGVRSPGGHGLGLVAGTAARVALDVVTGGISALPAVISAVAAPAVGSIASKVIEKVGDSLVHDANDVITGKVKEKLKKETDDATVNDAGTANAPSALGEKVLTVDDLAAITRWVAETLGVAEALQPDSIRVKRYQVPSRAVEDVSTDDFLNSFYADDLERVAEAVATGESSAALTEYLRADGSIDQARRVDVRERPTAVLGAGAPTSAPLGRWPAEPDRPLTLSQQFAINRIQHDLMAPAARGLYAVNGPPGTGKTTMLRDMIAAVVVERALRLADLKTPRDAFVKTPKEWQTGDEDKIYRRTIYPLRSDLTGYEIVVASSNNGAVENITLEVPSAKTVDRESFPDADYLAGPATLLTGTPSWGAVAARLGRRDFRREFVDRFWWGNGGRGKREQTEFTNLAGLDQFLRQLVDADDEELLPWPEAVKRFNSAVYDARRLAHERQEIADIQAREAGPDSVLIALREVADARRAEMTRQRARCSDAQRNVTAARADFDRARNQLAHAHDSLTSALAKVDRMTTQVQSAMAALNSHTTSKPGLFQRLLHWHALRDWREGLPPLTEAVNQAGRLQREAETQLSTCEAVRSTCLAERDNTDKAVQRCVELLARCQLGLEQAVAVLDSADKAVSEARGSTESVAAIRSWGRMACRPR